MSGIDFRPALLQLAGQVIAWGIDSIRDRIHASASSAVATTLRSFRIYRAEENLLAAVGSARRSPAM